MTNFWGALLVFLLLSLLGPSLGRAQEAESSDATDITDKEQRAAIPQLLASGLLRTNYFHSSRLADGKTDFYGLTAQTKIIPVFSEFFSGKVDARVIYPDLTHNRIASEATLLEGYVTLHLNQVDLRVGKQNVPWGRADSANPTDNLTPRDYMVFLPFDEDQRFGTTGVKLDVRLTPEYTVTLFATPLFEPSKVPMPLPPGTVIMAEEKPAHRLSNSEVGLKIDKTGGETDWSISYYHGYSLIPEIVYSDPIPSRYRLKLKYPKMNVFGVDLAKNYNRYSFRAELAYFAVDDYSSQELTTLQSYLSYVIGVDRTFIENLNVNVQLVGTWVPDYRNPAAISDPVIRNLATQNATQFTQLHRTNYGLTCRINDRWLNDTLEAETLMMMYFNPWNSYLRPFITYAFTDRIKGAVGAEIYGGAQNTYLGSINKNQGVFVEFRYNFL